jgi:hypothetical protein
VTLHGHPVADGKAIHLGHHDIEEHEIRCIVLDEFKGLLAIARGQDVKAFQLEIAGHPAAGEEDHHQQRRALCSLPASLLTYPSHESFNWDTHTIIAHEHFQHLLRNVSPVAYEHVMCYP